MTENRKFWFILEPYVFLWSDNSEVLFYNSLAGEGLVFPNKRNIRDLINKLEDKCKQSVNSVLFHEELAFCFESFSKTFGEL